MGYSDNSKIAYVGVHLGFCADPNNSLTKDTRKLYEQILSYARVDEELKQAVFRIYQNNKLY